MLSLWLTFVCKSTIIITKLWYLLFKIQQCNEFMGIGRIILENSAMMPPMFDDVQTWVKLRKFVNKTFKLKDIVKHWIFELIISILIIASFVNAILYSFQSWPVTIILDDIFVWIFVVELLMRVLAFGPETFFADRWNKLDSLLIGVSLVFFFLPLNHGASSISRMGRIFRIASLLRVLSHSSYIDSINFRYFLKLS